MPHSDPEKRKEYMREWNKKHSAEKREYNRRYQIENRDRIREVNSQWKKRNKEKVRESSRKDYLRHRDRILAKHKEWKEANREKVNIWARGYRRTSTVYRNWVESTKEKRRLKIKEWRKTSPKYRQYVEASKDKVAKQQRVWRRLSPAYASWKNSNRDKIRVYARERYRKQVVFNREYQNSRKYARRVAVCKKWEACGRVCYICGKRLALRSISVDHVVAVTRGGSNEIDNLMPSHKACNVRKGNRIDFPVARPDLVGALVGLFDVHPRKPPRNGGTAASRARAYQKQKAKRKT